VPAPLHLSAPAPTPPTTAASPPPTGTTATLPLRQLGSSPLRVTNVCLGTMTFGVQNTEAEGHAQLDYGALPNQPNPPPPPHWLTPSSMSHAIPLPPPLRRC
jgi:hypothetical protein